jgi:addiction module RelB/DinJ family antitoxin
MNNYKMTFGTDKELKEACQELLNNMGLNLTTYFNMSMTQLLRNNGIPFEVKGNMTRVDAIKKLKSELHIWKSELDEGRVFSESEVRAKFKH